MLSSMGSVPEFLADQYDGHSIREQARFDNDELAADPMRRMAVGIVAETEFGTGCLLSNADGIHGTSHGFDPGNRIFHGLHHFVHAHHQNDFMGAVYHGSNTVADAVLIHDFSICSNSVTGGNEDIGEKTFPPHFIDLFGGDAVFVSVKQSDIHFAEGVNQPSFDDGFRSSQADECIVRDHFTYCLNGILAVIKVHAVDVLLFHDLDDLLSLVFIREFLCSIHDGISFHIWTYGQYLRFIPTSLRRWG